MSFSDDANEIWRWAIDRAGARYLYTNSAAFHAEAERVHKVLQAAAEVLQVQQVMDRVEATRFLEALAIRLTPPVDEYVTQHTRQTERILRMFAEPVRIPVELRGDPVATNPCAEVDVTPFVRPELRGALRAQGDGETVTGSQLAEVARRVADSDSVVSWFGPGGARLVTDHGVAEIDGE